MFINFGCAAVIRPLHTLRSARRDQARAHGHGAESSRCERLRPVLCSAPPCVTRRLPAGGPLPFAGRRPPMPGFGVRPWALARLRRLLAACTSARGRDRGPRLCRFPRARSSAASARRTERATPAAECVARPSFPARLRNVFADSLGIIRAVGKAGARGRLPDRKIDNRVFGPRTVQQRISASGEASGWRRVQVAARFSAGARGGLAAATRQPRRA